MKFIIGLILEYMMQFFIREKSDDKYSINYTLQE